MTAIASMTGFARAEGAIEGIAWAWELRSVNGRTLELRFRLPNGWDSLEAGWRELAGKALKRGNVTANLTIKRQSETRLELDPAALEQVLKIATDLHHRIPGSQPPSPEALLSLPGVLRQAQADQQEEKAAAAGDVQAGFVAALADLVASRQAEGDRLAVVLNRQLDEIAALCETATTQAAGQPAAQRARMLDNLQTLLRETPALVGGADRPGSRVARQPVRRARGTGPLVQPHRCCPRPDARGGQYRPQAGFPDPGVQSRGEYAVQQVRLARPDRDRTEAEGRDRAVARAGAEHRMIEIARRGVCLVLSAPSGAGKTAIADALVATEPMLERSISVTTRERRPAEIDGVHYHFLTEDALSTGAA